MHESVIIFYISYGVINYTGHWLILAYLISVLKEAPDIICPYAICMDDVM